MGAGLGGSSPSIPHSIPAAPPRSAPEIPDQSPRLKPTNNSDYYHPQTKFMKVMLSQVSVCPRGRGQNPPPCTRPMGQRPLLDRDHPRTETSPSYGKERVVRILLDCILVLLKTISGSEQWLTDFLLVFHNINNFFAKTLSSVNHKAPKLTIVPTFPH